MSSQYLLNDDTSRFRRSVLFFPVCQTLLGPVGSFVWVPVSEAFLSS